MKIEEELQHSQELASHFAKYCEEAPLLSTSEVEQLLTSRVMLDHPSRNIIRNSIMTLAGLTGIGAIAYFAFFTGTNGTNTTDGTDRTYTVNQSHETHPSHETAPQSAALPRPLQHTQHTCERGPWSAGNDQFYADLSPEELAKLGIVVAGEDSVLSYKLTDKDSVACTELSNYAIKGTTYRGHSIGGLGPLLASAPKGVHAQPFYPLLMTFSNGNGAAYRIEDDKQQEVGLISESNIEKDIRAWLEKPGTQGYRALTYEHNYSAQDGKHRRDSVKIIIGKDLPQPSFIPFGFMPIDGYSDTVAHAVFDLARYYDGSSSTKPKFEQPAALAIKVDTVTANDLLAQMDAEENSSTMQHLHSIMARINELVPVIVRMKPGNGKPTTEDFIFWYEPSEELFNALPPAQASVFRAKLAAPPHCLTMPNDAITSAEITYCVSEPQHVQVLVHDLTGRVLMVFMQKALAGDNVLRFSTKTLASGMYVVTVHEKDGTERSRRIWVENAHPTPSPKGAMQLDIGNAADETASVNYDNPPNGIAPAVQHPELLTIPSLELNAMSLAKIGVESNDMLAAYYTNGSQPSVVNYLGVMRSWGAVIKSLDRSSVTNITIQSFQPSLVTDGIGRKRLFTSDFTSDSNYNAYVPVLLRAGTPSDSIGARDLIFWYQPTPEFLAALPDSARVIAKNMTGQSSNASVHSRQGVIEKASTYPNPSKGSFTLKLTLGTSRALTLTMRNLLGQQVAPPVVVHADGTTEQMLNFDSLGEGVYLLDVTSDAGEECLQRVVIVR